jgi:hypothetical protein
MDASDGQASPGMLYLSAYCASGLLGLWLLLKTAQAVYNISPFHPLSHIPGPKLAAATYLPELYYDVIKFGCYTKEIARMHKVYGKGGN